MKKIILILISVFCILSVRGVKADHLAGGEITWKCLKSGPDAGKFVFQLVLYWNCNGASNPTSETITAGNGCPVTSIPVTLVSSIDLSPVCDPTGCPGQTQLSCSTASSGSIGQLIFESAPVVLAGVPPADGWLFKYESCCYSTLTANLDQPTAYAFRAIMYPYNNQNTNPCFDSSPQFIEKPNCIMNTGYPNTYSHNAADEELDVLTYSWTSPVQSYIGMNPVPSDFALGYSVTNQLPNTFQNPNNVAAVLDSTTGDISFTSYTTGKFSTSTRIQARKYGQLVAEIYRDVQVNLLTAPLAYPGASPNQPPNVNKPFYGGTSYDTTVFAGDSVCFNILAEDYDEKCALVFQNVTLQASGFQFSLGFSSTTTGCLFPPCPSLNPPPGDSLVTNVTGSTSSKFCWQTACQHLYADTGTYVNDSMVYAFTIKVYDDFCPVPGLNQMTAKITVKDRPTIPASSLRCTEVLPNGSVKLSWVPVTESPGIFNGYEIWSYDSVSGTYSHLTTLSDSLNTSWYIDTTADAGVATQPYYVKTSSGCYQSATSNNIHTIGLYAYSVEGVPPTLTWNAISYPLLPSSTGMYKVYRHYLGTWTLIDSVYNVTDSILYYIDQSLSTPLLDSVQYRVEVDDASGCTSVSNVTGVSLFSGIDESMTALQVKLYPNPANNAVHLEIQNYQSEKIEIDLKNQLGQTIQKETLQPKNGKLSRKIQIDNLAPGIYFINVKSGNNIRNLKFIKL